MLKLTGGLSYDELTFPANGDLPPVRNAKAHRSQFGPKGALMLDPWPRGRFRFAYARSLGGLYFDNSVRLEPTQLAGFTHAFRSLLPESATGLVPGTAFETLGVGFDQAFDSGTYIGLQAERLRSDATREAGAFQNSTPIPLPEVPTWTRQSLDFEERSLSVYANQLLGESWAFGVRYRLSEASFQGAFPDLPRNAAGLADLEQDERSLLGQLQLFVVFNHSSGLFAQAYSDYIHQHNRGYEPARGGEALWQHHAFAGYRWPRHRAEIRIGLLNITDTDYRLSPLNAFVDPPRHRTATLSLKLNF